jgi:hypothetical protein
MFVMFNNNAFMFFRYVSRGEKYILQCNQQPYSAAEQKSPHNYVEKKDQQIDNQNNADTQYDERWQLL